MIKYTTEEPILAQTETKRPYNKYTTVFKVEGGLQYIRGNKLPYFTLTYTEHRKGFPNQCYSGGAGHDEILKLFPQFADLAKMHLSDIDGLPMHSFENGWYWLSGACGGLNEKYHGGSDKSEDECLRIFADHCRVSVEEAEKIREDILDTLKVHQEHANKLKYTDPPHDSYRAAKNRWFDICQSMRERWKKEAKEVIEKYNLKVFGDFWKGDQE